MCGIIGYIGSEEVQPILLDGLARMEYRGYDSAGIAVLSDGQLNVVRAVGKVAALKEKLQTKPAAGQIGIGHTRWATHGAPSERNAHPHLAGDIAVVHNGIIENYQEIKAKLQKKGVVFNSDTDTEALAQLINQYYQKNHNLIKSVQKALREIRGTFGIAVICAQDPSRIIGARRGSPLQVGISKDGIYLASDTAALVGRASEVIYLEDDQMAVCTKDRVAVLDLDLQPQVSTPELIKTEIGSLQKQGYDHFMLKEIMEQPTSVEGVLRGHLDHKHGTSHLGGLNLTDKQIRAIDHIVIVSCGTALISGQLGKYYIEKLTGIPVSVEVASEFRYRSPILSKNTLAIVISQSGETADTLACVEELKRRGIHTLGLVNVVGSSIARAVDGGIYLHAGPEISVASTKAYTSMVVAQLLLAVYIGRRRDLSLSAGQEVISALERLPKDIETALKLNAEVKKIARKAKNFKNAFFMGRNSLYPVAQEGSIKLKEISYIHAESYPAGEAKHGPIALVDKDMLIVFLLGKGHLAEKSLSNLQEMKARGGVTLLITDTKIEDGKYRVYVPTHSEWTAGILINIPQQLLAYHIAVALGHNVDQPRNLAKSVTVE